MKFDKLYFHRYFLEVTFLEVDDGFLLCFPKKKTDNAVLF